MSIDREKAKLILTCSPWAQSDSSYSDPEIEEAFALLETDAELQEWFEQEQEVDEAISQKVREAACPEGLLEDLHRFVERSEKKHRRSKVIKFGILPLASAAVLGFMFLVYQLKQPFDFQQVNSEQTFAAFRHDMSDYASSRLMIMLQHKSQDFAELNDWLASNEGPQYGELPSDVSALKSIGCSALAWGPKKASLLCFRNGENQVVHIFMIPRTDLDNVPDQSALAALTPANGLETAAWVDDSMLYMLCGSKPGVSVAEFLPAPLVAKLGF